MIKEKKEPIYTCRLHLSTSVDKMRKQETTLVVFQLASDSLRENDSVLYAVCCLCGYHTVDYLYG